MKAVHKRRLLNVARALRDEAQYRKAHKPRGAEDVFTMTRFGNTCGSPACALGTYAASKYQRTFTLANVDGGSDGWLGLALRASSPTFLDFNGHAVREHFGLNGHEAHSLFSAHGCGGAQTERDAAEFITAFVARKERKVRP